MAGEVSSYAVRSAAAVMVLVDGSQADLTALPSGVGLEALRAQLCEGERAARARALSALLTSVAIDLSDWGLR